MKNLIYALIILIILAIATLYLNADCGISRPIPTCNIAPAPDHPQLTTSQKADIWFHIFLPYYI